MSESISSLVQQYSSKNVISDKGLIVIRRRPTQYLPDIEHMGINWGCYELADNSIDEMTAGFATKLSIVICKDPDRKTFQFIVQDNGRGIPLDDHMLKEAALVRCYTEPHSSGKYEGNAYYASAGLFGNGAKVATGTSSRLRVISQTTALSGSLHVDGGLHFDGIDIEEGINSRTGLTTFYEPDSTIFYGVDTYIDNAHYLPLVERLKRVAYFYPVNILIKLSDKPVSEEMYTKAISKALVDVETIINDGFTLFDSNDFNRRQWILSQLGLKKTIDWETQLTKPVNPTSDEKVSFTIQLFYSHEDNCFNKIGLINSIPIDDGRSDHIARFDAVFKDVIASRIENSKVKDFFNNSYKLPVGRAIEVKYANAEFSNTTKNSFFDPIFRELYGQALHRCFESDELVEKVNDLYKNYLKDKIQEAYEASLTVSKNKQPNRMFLSLKRGDKFTNCSTEDRTRAELFLFEGSSAGSAVRDPETMAMYQLGGKPFNGVTTFDKIESDALTILSKPIYFDIFKLLGVDRRNPNKADLLFSKIVILSDADAHGRHIASILIGNLYVVCPELIEWGVIHIATPPDYGLTYIGPHKGEEPKVTYFRTENDLRYWLSRNLYQRGISVTTVIGPNPPKPLDDPELYFSFASIVIEIGQIFDNLAKEFKIPPIIVEALTYISQYLNPTHMNVHAIKDILECDKVFYDHIGNVLTLSLGRLDYIIPLEKIDERMYSKIIPLLSKILWRQLKIYITNADGKVYKDRYVTLYQLYQIYCQLESVFNVEKYKGLAKMNEINIFETCMNPSNRVLLKIERIGDVNTIFDLLGNSQMGRQELLSSQFDL